MNEFGGQTVRLLDAESTLGAVARVYNFDRKTASANVKVEIED